MFNPRVFWTLYNWISPEQEPTSSKDPQIPEKSEDQTNSLNISFVEQTDEDHIYNNITTRGESNSDSTQENTKQKISLFLLLQDNKQNTNNLKTLINPRKSFTCQINNNPKVKCYLRETKKWTPSEYLSFIKGFDQKYKIPKFEDSAKLYTLDLDQVHELELQEGDVKCLNIALGHDDTQTCMTPLFLVHNSKIMWVNQMFEEILPV